MKKKKVNQCTPGTRRYLAFILHEKMCSFILRPNFNFPNPAGCREEYFGACQLLHACLNQYFTLCCKVNSI